MPLFLRKCFSAACRCMGRGCAGGGGADHRDRRSRKRARLVDSLQPDNFTGGAATFTRTGIEVEDMDPLQRIHDNVLGFDIDDESGSVEEIGERSPEVFTGPAAAQGEIINRLPFDPLQRVQENLIMVDVDESGSVKEIGEGNSETFTGLIEALPEIINLLPVEDKVRTVPLVCKAWREALSHPASWRSVDFRSWIRDRWIRHDDRLSEEAQERIIQQVVDRSSGQLREFCTTGGLCTTKSVEYVALKCTLLKCLTITDTSRLHDSSAMELAQRCRQLQTLDLSDCYNISKETLKIFLKRDRHELPCTGKVHQKCAHGFRPGI
ncbi:hypothetical protein Mapa_002718 [Marchantia paleacea]|nr:hypothetical protein Mapa_002718 [Marchantia paleacea]